MSSRSTRREGGDTPSRLALPPPAGDVVAIDDVLISRVLEESRRSTRRRVILPFHASADDPLHRMLNAIQPGSYVRPHRHLSPPKSEAIIVLRGALACFTFSASGEIARIDRLAAGTAVIGIDFKPRIFHTFCALAPDTLLFEVKPGPYSPADDKDFAPWAPAEGDAGTIEYLLWLTGLLQPETE